MYILKKMELNTWKKKSGSRAARTSSYGADNPMERGIKKGKELSKNKKL
jgi:hypothetical protein